MVSIEKVFKIIDENVKVIKKSEFVRTQDLLERCISQNIISKINIPPHDNSAVDGYLFSTQAVTETRNVNLPFLGKIRAGDKLNTKKFKNGYYQVSTGSCIPDGYNAVVMQENIIKSKNKLNIRSNLVEEMNIRKKGEDVKKNQIIFQKGHIIRAQDIGMIASLGLTRVRVKNKIKIGILSNGNELVEPGMKKNNFQIYDSNRYMLANLIGYKNLECFDAGISDDNYLQIKKKITYLKKKCDLIILSGGASTGEQDYINLAVSELGSLKVWKVSMKPGRPFGFGLINKNIPVIMLPGNPVASFTTFQLFGKYLINHMIGNKNYLQIYFSVRSNFSMKKKLGREEYLRGKLFYKKGLPYVDKYKTQGAGILNSLVWANGFIRLKKNVKNVKKNDILDFMPFNSF